MQKYNLNNLNINMLQTLNVCRTDILLMGVLMDIIMDM